MRSLLAAALLALAACGPVHRDRGRTAKAIPLAETLEVGAPVAARWSDGKWYFGHVSDIRGTWYAIEYADGDHGTVGPGQILPISPPEQIVPGAHVLAVWKGTSMYPGVVLTVARGHARVRWDDGDLPLDVPFERVAVIGYQATYSPNDQAP